MGRACSRGPGPPSGHRHHRRDHGDDARVLSRLVRIVSVATIHTVSPRLFQFSPPPPGWQFWVPDAQAPVGERNTRSIPQDVKIAVAARDGGRCRQCGSTTDLHFDHVIPWSKGGANTVPNIQLLCGPCNRRKGADDIPVGSHRDCSREVPTPRRKSGMSVSRQSVERAGAAGFPAGCRSSRRAPLPSRPNGQIVGH